MLQQTQARTVVPYYSRFLDAFPSIDDLASARLDDVLGIWSGLGYYSRARNMHRAAQIVRRRLDGNFPKEKIQLMQLPGIGRSTAGAICALAYGLQEPILDGNAKRVYSRAFEVDGESESARLKTLWAIAEELTPEGRSAEYTQAIMDLGAETCTPKNPGCDTCPVSEVCGARLNGRQERYPIRAHRADVSARSVTLVIAMDRDGRVLLERRPESGIWAGLWSLPECDRPANEIGAWFAANYSATITLKPPWPKTRHRLTHLLLEITPQPATVTDCSGDALRRDRRRFVPLREAREMGLPAPVTRIVDELLERQEP